MANGLEADMQKMTQAEKTMLRYQYVLANTGAASGDFLRTINSWHNQLVLLAGGFQQLGSIVGSVLINAFKPFIQALNNVVGAVINFAQVVSDALGAIFGWEYQTGGGVAQDLEAGAGAAQDIEDATGGAADNAKKLNKYIAGWHEVNNMTSNKDSGGSGGGGGAGGGGLADADGGKWVQKESLWEKYTSSIDSLYELGDYISGVLTDAMNSIDWNKVYESARNFGSGLASFLNGLISPELFGATGRTIAGALNTAIYAALSFGETFDWTDFGDSIASGVNNFFATFDFGALANTIDTWVQGIWTTIKTAVQKIEWKTIWDGITDFISEIDLETVALVIGAITIKNIGKIILSAGILSTLKTAVGGKISAAIMKGISFSGIGKFLSKAFPASTIIQTITTTMAETGASLPTVLLNLIWTPIQTFLTVTLPGFITSGISSLATTVGVSVTAAGGIVVAAVAAAIAAIVAVVTNWDEIKVFFTDTLPSWWNGTALPFFQSIPDKLGEVWETVKKIASQKWGQLLDFMRTIPNKVSEIISSIGEWFGQLPEKIGYGLGYALGTVTKWGSDLSSYVSEKIPEIIENIRVWFSELPDKIYNAISTAIQKVSDWGTGVYTAFQSKIKEIIEGVRKWFSEVPKKIYDEIIKVKGKVSEWATNTISFFRTEVPKIVDSVVGFFKELPKKIVVVGEDLIRGLWNGINNMVDWLGTKISGFVQGVIDGFKEGFDEHSPSKIAFEIGDYWTIGLGNGMTGGFDGIYRQIDSFTSKVGSTQIPVPRLNTYVPKSNLAVGSYNAGDLQTTMRMEMDARMARQQSELKQQNKLLQEQNELLRGIYNKPVLSDDDVFNATRRGQNRFAKRTFKTGWAGID